MINGADKFRLKISCDDGFSPPVEFSTPILSCAKMIERLEKEKKDISNTKIAVYRILEAENFEELVREIVLLDTNEA